MLTDYIKAAMHKARYEFWPDTNEYYGEIPGLQGVMAVETTLESCRDELESVLESWLIISLRKNLPIPPVDNISIDVKDAA